MPDASTLATAVNAFVIDVTAALAVAAAPVQSDPNYDYRADVVREAEALSAAFIDVDDRHTDAELVAYHQAFDGFIDGLPSISDGATALRTEDRFRGRKTWLNTPSTLFDILTARESTDGSAWLYFRRAMDIAHMIVSLDEVASQAELLALSAFRAMLIERIRTVTTGATQLIPHGLAPHGLAPHGLIPDSADPGGVEPASVADPERSTEELLAELDSLVGLAEVKAEVKLVTDLLLIRQLRESRGLPSLPSSLHLVFVGNPGTGKTTVARLLAQIYRSVGVVSTGQLVETDRSGLVAGYIGQTAPLVEKRFDEARGGILFIDEAYTLARGGENDFGREAIDALVKLMEDRRDDTVVVAAGYPEEMAEFISSNPGLASRFPRTIKFPDYTDDELMEIFEGICERHRYVLTEQAAASLRAQLADVPRTKGFGNGRYVRNVFEAMVAKQASRVVKIDNPTDEDLITFEVSDLASSLEADATATTPAQLPTNPDPRSPAVTQ